MSKRLEKIRKVLDKTLLSGNPVDENLSMRDIVDSCEKEGRLFSHKGLFMAPVLSRCQGKDCLRCIFLWKEADSGKVQTVEQIVDLVQELEEILVSLDVRKQNKADGFIYFEIIKILEEKE